MRYAQLRLQQLPPGPPAAGGASCGHSRCSTDPVKRSVGSKDLWERGRAEGRGVVNTSPN
mgnify:CR=1 FL=1